MALPSSGSEIKISAIYNNQQDTSGTPSAGTNISLDSLSDSFGANASIVGDLDGNGINNQSSDRDVLTGNEDKLGHFWGSNFPGNFTTIILYKGAPTSTTLSSAGNQLVEGESLGVFAAHETHDGDDQLTFTVVKNDGSAVGGSSNSGVTGTENDNSIGQYTFDNVLDINDEDNESLKLRLTDSNNSFDTNFSDAFTYRRQIAGGSLSFATQKVDNAGDSVNDLTPSPSVSTGTLVSSSFTSGTAVTAGDGGTMTVTLSDSTPDNGEGILEIANTPGVVQVAMKLFGNPVGTRNVINSVTANVNVEYNRAISNVGRTPQNVNTGGTVTVSAHSKGANGLLFVLGVDDDNTSANMLQSSTKNVDSRYVEDTSQTHTFTLNHSSPNSSTSKETLFPKAKYSSGTAATTAGSAIFLFPNLIYATSGDKSVNVNGSAQAFAASLTSGHNAGMTISSNFNGSTQSGFGGSLTLTPGTANGSYTISYAGTADSSQTNNQTDTFLVIPLVSLVEDNSATTADVLGSYSSGLTPTGHTQTNLAFTATATGDTIQFNWTAPSDFTTTAGGGTGQSFLQGNFGAGSSGITYTFQCNVSGNGATSTTQSINISATVLSQQALTNLTTDSQTVRRAASNDLGVNFTSTNMAKADIIMCFASVGSGNEESHADSHTLSATNGQTLINTKNTATAQSFDYNVPDVGVNKLGLYDIYVRDEDSSGEHLPDARTSTSQDVVVIDKAPTDPGNFSTTSGGYSGDQAIVWSASTYAAKYKVFKATSEGGSYSHVGTPTSNSFTITADSNNTLDFFYKVQAQNDNSAVETNGGPPTADESSGFNGARQYTIFPVGANTKNVIANNNQLVRTSFNNSTSTSFTFNDPTNETDTASIVSYAYSLTTNPGGATLNNTSSQNAQFVAGSASDSTGTGVVQLITTLEGGNDSDTTCTSTSNVLVKHYPKITASSSFPNPTKKNLTTISPTSITYQGYRNNGTDMTITFRIVRTGTSTVINDEGEVTVSDSSIVDSDITPVSINDLVCNLGIITGTLGSGNQATLQAKFNNNNTAQDPDPGFEDLDTVVVRVPQTLTLYVGRVSSAGTTFTGAHNSAEEAFLDSSIPANNDVVIFPATSGAPAQGEDLFVLQGDGGLSPANGNNKYMKIYQIDGLNGSVNSDVIRIATDGQISEYYDFADVPPLAATSISTSQSTTNVTLSDVGNPSDFTFGSGGQTITLTSKQTTKSVTVSWTDNSTINDSYSVIFNGTTSSGNAGTATSKTFTSITNGSYSAPTVNAIRGTSTTSANGSSVTVNNDANLFIQAKVYKSLFTGIFVWNEEYTQNITFTTNATSFTLDGITIDPPRDSSRLGSGVTYNSASTPTGTDQYQIRLVVRKDSYSGTVLQESNPFNVSMNTTMAFNNNAGALNVSVNNGADFHYFGGTSIDNASGTGEWTNSDTINQYLEITDGSNFRTKTNGVSLSVNHTTYGTSDGINRYYFKLLDQASTTTSGTSGWSNQVFTVASNNIATFDSTNDKLFIVFAAGASTDSSSGTDTIVMTASAVGYDSDSFTLGLSVDAPSGGGTGGGDPCFPYGTKIWMADGTWKNIEDLSINDKVKSYDLSSDDQPSTDKVSTYLGYKWDGMTGKLAESTVVQKTEDYYYDHYELTLENGEVITATYEHPLFVKRTTPDGDTGKNKIEYRWVRIYHIDKEFDEVMTIGGTAVGITDLTYNVGEEIFVHIGVEDIDNYFIKTGDSTYIAHNAGGKGGD